VPTAEVTVESDRQAYDGQGEVTSRRTKVVVAVKGWDNGMRCALNMPEEAKRDVLCHYLRTLRQDGYCSLCHTNSPDEQPLDIEAFRGTSRAAHARTIQRP
jgi:hypothetical protein